MNNTKKEIGGWSFANPALVIKLGLVLDAYKLPQLKRLWLDAEKEARSRMPLWRATDLFHQEQRQSGDLIFSFRYYTPLNNRQRVIPG